VLKPGDRKNIEPVIERMRKKIDIAFIALHGRFGEDGMLQAMLETIGMPYTGSGVNASVIAMDKILTKKFFLKNRIPAPEFTVLRRGGKTGRIELPCVVKPASSGSSIGVSIVFRRKDLMESLRLAWKHDSSALVEEYVPGREITVGVLNKAALPVVEIVPGLFRKKGPMFHAYRAKYSPGGSDHIIPARLPEAQSRLAKKTAEKVYEIIGCSGVVRVDMIAKRNGSVVVLEVNTIPGLTQTSLVPEAAGAAGISFLGLVLEMCESALRRKR